MRVTAVTSGSFLHGTTHPRGRRDVVAGQVYELDDDAARAGIASGYLVEGGDDPAPAQAAPAVSLPVDDGIARQDNVITDPAQAGDLNAAIGETVFPAPDTVGAAGTTTMVTAASSEQITGHPPVDPDQAQADAIADAKRDARDVTVTDDPGPKVTTRKASARKATGARKPAK
jgi:hypothetical protein